MLEAADDTGAEVVVMASHLPRAADAVWPSNGIKVAAQARASVFVVRET
ncbi:hypothetical protein [Jannaschia formosa]|nr:hypothetical protein [Jannaschia formosa]